MEDDTTPRFTLDAYAARDCPVKVQNRFDATLGGLVEAARADSVAGLSAVTDANRQGVYAKLESDLGATGLIVAKVTAANVTDTAAHDPAISDVTARVDATRAAVAAGVDVIVGPVLPPDYRTHRASRPDVLVRYGKTASGEPGYLPVQVKMHRVLGRTTRHDRSLLTSTFASPFVSDAVRCEGWSVRNSQEGDLIQLAHYWRHLEGLGWAGVECAPMAGLIGTDTEPLGNAIVFNDLSEKRLSVVAKTNPDKERPVSALERYDHEFAFRVKVALTALARRGTVDDPPAMVQPVRIRECERCSWWSTCAAQLSEDDLSVSIAKSPLAVHETLALRSLGVMNVDDLAQTDLERLLLDYLPLVGQQPQAEDRLRLAAHRATLIAQGVELERQADSGPVVVPRASVEIDFDIETSRDSRVYLWGFLVCEDGGAPQYVHFSRFEKLTARSEGALAKLALTWLVKMLREHPDALVYHYSNYELINIDKFRSQHCARELRGELQSRFIDLFGIVKKHFFGVHGLGLKSVANSGAGFTWRDADASGLNSQSWFEEAAFSEDDLVRSAAQRRVLEYNEDDVRATLALREWLATVE